LLFKLCSWQTRYCSSSSLCSVYCLSDTSANVALVSCDSSVSVVTRLWAGQTGFDSQQGQGVLIFAIASRPALGPTQPPIQWVPGALLPGAKRPWREADHSLHLVPRSRMYGAIPPLPLYAFMVWCSVKAQAIQ
jgi:hypothetical protein